MSHTNLFSLIRTKYNTLSNSQKNVADYILENPEKVMYTSLGSLATTLNVSETTILRFLRKIDYSSYQVFKVHIAQEITDNKKINLFEEVTESDSSEEIIDKIIQSTVKAIQDSRQSIDIKEFDEFVLYIMQAKKIFVIGIGSSSAEAFDLYHKLLKLGMNCSFSSDTHIINITCNSLTKDDCLICISHTGESHEILNATELAQKKHCKICSITSYEKSSLTNKSDCSLISASVETHYRSDALSSRIIQITFIDMLYVSLAIKLGHVALDNIEKSREAVAINKR